MTGTLRGSSVGASLVSALGANRSLSFMEYDDTKNLLHEYRFRTLFVPGLQNGLLWISSTRGGGKHNRCATSPLRVPNYDAITSDRYPLVQPFVF